MNWNDIHWTDSDYDFWENFMKCAVGEKDFIEHYTTCQMCGQRLTVKGHPCFTCYWDDTKKCWTIPVCTTPKSSSFSYNENIIY